MENTTNLTLADVEKILEQWKVAPPSAEETDLFLSNAISDLNNAEKAEGFKTNIEEVGAWANETDEAFGRVKRGLEDIWEKYGKDFPDLAKFRADWLSYNARWVTLLSTSRDVASTHINILERYDKVFLRMVEEIKDDQTREDAIEELGRFASEDHSESHRMSVAFGALQKDILNFVERFDAWIESVGTDLKEQAVELRSALDGLQRTIVSLTVQIFATTVALAASAKASATLLSILGVIAAAATLIVLMEQRVRAEIDLRRTQRELAEVNRLQQALARLKGDFDGLKPDINLICDKLALFGEIWESVRSETVRFQTELKSGMGVVQNARFRKEVRLARSVCGPLQGGLERYATKLATRAGRESHVE